MLLIYTSEHDKRERDLRKSIQDLSRGVHAGDKTYMALRTELDQAQNKIKILETKKADVSSEDLSTYNIYLLLMGVYLNNCAYLRSWSSIRSTRSRARPAFATRRH